MDYNLIKEKLPNLKVLVIGDYMIDHYMMGSCERISPEAPVPVVDIKSESITLGGAGNVVKNLSSLGLAPDAITIIGDDSVGDELINLLQDLSVNVEGVFRSENRKTSKKTRVLVSNHQMMRFDNETKNEITSEEKNKITSYLSQNIAKYNLVLISDYAKGVLTDDLLEFIINLCNQQGIHTIVDPKGINFRKYRNASIIKPNRKEASIATGLDSSNHKNLRAIANKLKSELGCESLIITLSEEGMAIYDNHFDIIPTKAKEVFDVTGAGDTVLAALGLSIAAGYNIKDACIFANHAAAIVVSRVGSATTTLDEVINHIENNL